MNRPSPPQSPPFSAPGFDAEPTEHPIQRPSHDALPAGARFAEYEILSVLSESGSGIVYLAMDHGLQRQVAIKEYLPAALASRGSGSLVTLRSDGHAETFALGLRSFVDEARLLARFDHPALMRVHRFWEANGTAYMVMPRYEGVTVAIARQAMARPPDEAWLRELLLPLLGALDALHGAACYQREISPENILLLPDGRPVLLDRGAARHVLDDRNQSATLILNPAFAPIEQYAESATLRQGPWTSLYSLAAVAYYCVSGNAPVASTIRAVDDQMEPLFQVVDRLGRSFPGLDYSVAFVSAIERALRVRPQERPQSVAEFRRALLGGRGAAESGMLPPAAEEAEPQGASPPFHAARDEAGAFRFAPKAPDGGSDEDTSRERSAPWQAEAEPGAGPEPHSAWEAQTQFGSPAGQAPRGSVDDADDAALRDALAAALRLDPDDYGGFPPAAGGAKPGGGRRTLFIGVAAAVLVALAAGGWMMWSDYRDTSVALRAMARSMEPGVRPTPLLPPEPPAEAAAPAPSGTASAPQMPPPATAAPAAPAVQSEAALDSAESRSAAMQAEQAEQVPQEPAPLPSEAGPAAPLPEEAAAETEAPADDSAPGAPTAAEQAPTPPPPAKLVEREPDNPRVLCGPRTHFALYRCMKEACERPKYYEHRECKYLRVTDEVRALP